MTMFKVFKKRWRRGATEQKHETYMLYGEYFCEGSKKASSGILEPTSLFGLCQSICVEVQGSQSFHLLAGNSLRVTRGYVALGLQYS
jgi:hypothetical protein